MEKAAKFKLFGVEISVSVNDDEAPSSEYSSIPTTVHHDQKNNVAANYDDVLTTLSLGWLSATTQNPRSEVSRKSPAAVKRAFDQTTFFANNNNNTKMPFKKRFSPTISDDDVSRKSPAKKQSVDEIHDPSSSTPSTSDGAVLDGTKVYNPEPLRCYFASMDVIFSPSELGSSSNKPCQEKKKAKSIQKNKATKSNENKKKKEKSLATSKSRGTFDKSTVLPLEEIPGLMEIIGAQNRSTKPVFLYKKELKESDVKPDQNRLFVSGSDKELTEFLTEEEKAAVTDETGKGLELIGIDKQGNSYNLRMKNWGSVTIIAIIKEWTTMVKANNAQKGDWVELWGYRVENNEFRLVVNFRKSETGSSSSTSTSNVDGMAILPSPSPSP